MFKNGKGGQTRANRGSDVWSSSHRSITAQFKLFSWVRRRITSDTSAVTPDRGGYTKAHSSLSGYQ